MLLESEEAVGHFLCLDQTVERRDTVFKMTPRQEDIQHRLEAWPNRRNERGQLRYVLRLVLHDALGRLLLLNLI